MMRAAMRTGYALIALALVVSTCACGRREPAPKLDFVLYGDCRHEDGVHRSICAAMLRSSPAYVLNTGDLVDEPELKSDWDGFRKITKELRSRAAYYPVAGDHDLAPDLPFEKEFGLDKLYYDKVIGDIHYLFLDSTKFEDPAQMAWFEERAAASKSLHKIAVFHRPPFSIDPGRGVGDAVKIRAQIHDRLVKLKFCAAFCGHNHAFYVTARDGVRYVITGGGGAPLWKIDGSLAQKGDLWRKFYHYIGCRTAGKKITAQVFDEDGVEAKDLAFTVCEHP